MVSVRAFTFLCTFLILVFSSKVSADCVLTLGRLLIETPRDSQHSQAQALWTLKRFLERLPDGQREKGLALLHEVNSKLPWFGHHLSDSDRISLEANSWKSENAAAAMGRILSTFSDHANDGALRSNLVRFTVSDVLPPTAAIDALWDTTRGVGSLDRAEIKWANEKIIELQLKHSNEVPNLYISAENRALAERLGIPVEKHFSSPITSVYQMTDGAGISQTFIVHFANGKKAIFKPFWGENSYNKPEAHFNRIGFNREAQAYFFYQKYFKHDSIKLPVTVEAALHFNGRHFGVGSLQVFEEGYETLTKKYNPYPGYWFDWNNLGPVWSKQREDSRWGYYAPWIQTFDYVLGNVDRFPHEKARTGNPNNIMVKENGNGGLKIALIDNAKGRGYPLSLDYIPPAHDIPADLRERIKGMNDGTFAEIRRDFAFQLPADAVEDVIQRIRNVQNHIRHAGL